MRSKGLGIAPASARAARQVQRPANGARHHAWGGEGKGFFGKFVDVGKVSGEGIGKGIHAFVGGEPSSEDGKVSGGDSACEENGFLHGKTEGEGYFSDYVLGCEEKTIHDQAVDEGKVSGECKEEGTHGKKVGDGKVSGDDGL